MSANYVALYILMILHCSSMSECSHELQDIENIFSKCKKQSPQFDACMKQALNDMRPYFKRGIPEIGVAPFDPHFAKEIKQKLTILGIRYTLILRNVYERGWTKSTVTKFKTDWTNASISYSQYFPEKSLEGQYEFKSDAFGIAARSGLWNLTLRDYSQSTRVARGAGAGVRVRVQIDRIGDMDLHISSLLGGRTTLDQLLGRVINALWQPGLVLVRPVINDLDNHGALLLDRTSGEDVGPIPRLWIPHNVSRINPIVKPFKLIKTYKDV